MDEYKRRSLYSWAHGNFFLFTFKLVDVSGTIYCSFRSNISIHRHINIPGDWFKRIGWVVKKPICAGKQCQSDMLWYHSGLSIKINFFFNTFKRHIQQACTIHTTGSYNTYNRHVQYIQQACTIHTTGMYNTYNRHVQYIQHAHTIYTTDMYNTYNRLIQYILQAHTIHTTCMYNTYYRLIQYT